MVHGDENWIVYPQRFKIGNSTIKIVKFYDFKSQMFKKVSISDI